MSKTLITEFIETSEIEAAEREARREALESIVDIGSNKLRNMACDILIKADDDYLDEDMMDKIYAASDALIDLARALEEIEVDYV